MDESRFKHFTHTLYWKKYLPAYAGEFCFIFAKSEGRKVSPGILDRKPEGGYWRGMHSVGIEFPDGRRVVTSLRAIRKRKD